MLGLLAVQVSVALQVVAVAGVHWPVVGETARAVSGVYIRLIAVVVEVVGKAERGKGAATTNNCLWKGKEIKRNDEIK